MFSPPITKKLEGQEFIFNPNTDPESVILEITHPFLAAGKEIGWDTKTFGTVGFGVNRSITDFIESRKCRLVISVLSWNMKYWVNFDKLRHFRKFHPCEFTVKEKTIFVFPQRLFATKPNLEEQK